jgi:hypothetical protein
MLVRKTALPASRKRHFFNPRPTSSERRLRMTLRFLSAQPAFRVAVLLLAAGLLWTHPAAAQTADAWTAQAKEGTFTTSHFPLQRR